MEERAQTIDVKIKTKEMEAIKRKEDATLEKVTKARTEDSILQAKERREQLEIDKQLHMLCLRVKEEEAIQRKEGVTMERIEKARTEDSILQAKERRDYQLSQRVQTVGAIIETKSKEASRRMESYLLQKQQRACRKEQKERAEQRRKLLWYERRAKLLKSLDGKLERAAQRSNEITNEKAIKAGEELARAKEVARKVKAARVIQEIARDVYDFKQCEVVEIELSQHEAAARLQKCVAWSAAVCKRRLVANDVLDVDELLQLFRMPPKEKEQLDHCFSFEELTMQMRRPDIQQKATAIVDCLLPIIDIHFASSATSSSKGVDGRSLLTLFLIAIHPFEVLGDDFDGEDGDRCARGTKQLANAAAALLQSFSGLSEFSAPTLTTADLENISCYHTKSSALLNWWKQMDLEQLLAGLSKQLQQSWVIYITSSEALQYLTDVTGVDDTSESNAVQDDPLMQLRLRHKASQSGSRSHIKRIRRSLDKLIGSDKGREVVKEAKAVAKNEIAETKAVEVLKQEVDEMNDRFARGNDADYIESIMAPDLSSNDVAQDTSDDDKDATSDALPENIASNRNLIHQVLVTDPADFDKLSWDGVNSHLPEISPDQFMSTFLPETNSDDISPDDLPMRVAMNMKLAYFNVVAQEMSTGNYVPVQGLLKELHDKMRTLLPNRQDLHSHINDDDIGYSSCLSDIIRVLNRSGYLLANYLEAPSRAESTRELLGCLDAFNSRNRDGDGDNVPLTIPYEFETEHLFAVASIAFILQKVELCQMDVSNYKFAHQLAPFIHQVGHEYERSHFRKTHGDYGTVPIRELQQMLPSTHAWVRNTVGLFESTDNITMQSNLEQKMDFIKGRGFVDGILFTKQELVLPELFSLDIEGINSIRNEARCCVMASALSIHAFNIIGSSILKTEVGVVGNNELTSVLRKKHFERDDLEAEVIAALTSFTTALAERSLSEEECNTLKNHALAVLRGNDPVLKLLDNRIRSYFRYACRWTPDTKSTGERSAPIEMKTGRKVVKGDDDLPARSGVASSKAEFSLAAHKEAKRLGFTFVSSDLIAAGNKARLIISLVCSNYDKDILGRLLMAEK